jgi:membrane protease YdiL (CAAX protease family)
MPMPTLSPRSSRAVSAVELLLGSFVVIAHNVYHLVPNEVPILCIAGLLSLRLRDGGWALLGLKRPASWIRTIGIALGAAGLRLLMGEFVTDPLTAKIWPTPQELPEAFSSLTGNLRQAFVALLIVWTFAAFGEEIAYRGYLMTRAADLGGRSKAAYWAALLCVSVLFGLGHYWKGPGGMIDSGLAGAILGGAYLLCGRNLWVAILAHGFIDTTGVILLYFGWAS